MAKRRRARKRSSGGSSDDAGYRFDEKEADRICRFFAEALVHVKGRFAGEPFELEPWQRTVVRDLFGWYREDDTRRYRRAFIEVPRKNGKSTLLAGLGCFMLLADGEEGAEIYSVAAEREQAAIIFDLAKRMVELSPLLSERIKPFRRSMLHPPSDSWWRVLSSDAGTKHGFNPHCVLFDELHAQPNRELWDVMTTGQGARSQPLILAITTAGYDRESICYEVYDYAKKIQKGVIEDPSFYSCIFETEEKEDWTDPKVWKRANPNLGVSVSEEHLEEQARTARASPSAQNAFRRLHLNQWTQQHERWLDLAKWDACTGELMPAQLEELAHGRRAYGGLDLASTTDVAAFVVVIPPEDPQEGVFDVLCRFWVPEEGAYEREQRDGVPYRGWIRDGWVTDTEGNVTDYRVIRRDILKLSEVIDIREVAFDRWGAEMIRQDLEGEGLSMIAMGQGFASMAHPTRELLHVVLSKRLRHGGHPVLRWMADNLIVATDAAGNVKPDKKKSKQKIDGMVALIMALDRALRNEGQSVYTGEEGRGILVI